LSFITSIGCTYSSFTETRVFHIPQIDTYEKLYSEVDEVEGTKIFDTWFRVDARPFKQALLNIIKRWSYMFKQHLIDHVTNRYRFCLSLISRIMAS